MDVHVRPKSVCCSYNGDFKSLVIKHAEGNNKQDLAWKFCVVEQNVQRGKQKGLLTKTENSTQKGSSNGSEMSGTEDKMLFSRRQECWFYLLYGSLNIEGKNCNF